MKDEKGMTERFGKVVDFVKKHFGSLNWFLSIAAIVVSVFAYKETYRTNEIASGALDESKNQFLAVNKPIVVARQLKLGEGKDFFELESLGDNSLKVTAFVSLENIGPIIAGNVFVHSVTTMLNLDGKVIGRVETKFKPLNEHDNLSFLSIPPNQSVNRIVATTFTAKDLGGIPVLDKDRVTVGLNMLIYYYPDTVQRFNPIAEKQMYATNVTNAIARDRYETNMQTFLDRQTFDRVMSKAEGTK